MASNLKDPRRVILWGVPRCLSTAFMRAISNVDDFLVWYEPYLMVQKAQGSPELPEAMTSVDPAMIPDHFYNFFDESHTYSWVKDQLEGSFPGKKLVFVKEMVEGIHGHYEDLPKGYRHTIMIRHPLKVFISLKKMYQAFMGDVPDLDILPETTIPPGYFFKEMCEFVDHIKSSGMETNPIIIDADDLQANPDEVMKIYCKKVDIPYDDRIVKWTGNVSFDNWMAPKEVTAMFLTQGVHKKSRRSEGFSPPSELPSRADVPADVLRVADASMEYYDKLYAQRLVI